MESSPASLPTADTSKGDDLWGISLSILLFCWIPLVTVGGYGVAWVVDQALMISGMDWPIWAWPSVSLAQVLLLAVPLLPLALLWKRPRARAVFQTWAAGTLFMLVMLPLRLVPRTTPTTAAIGQVALALLFVSVMLLVPRWRRRLARVDTSSVAAALALGGLLALPWLSWGALGSPLDVALQLAAGVAFGLAVAVVSNVFLVEPFWRTSTSVGWDVTLGGFVLGALIAIMATAFGFQGMGWILAVALPAIGWAVMAVSYWGHSRESGGAWLGAALLVGIATAAPLALLDVAETLLILSASGGEVLQWVFRAIFVSIVLGWLLGVLLWLARNLIVSERAGWPFVIGALIVFWGLSIGAYFMVGQPGLYGDRLFVILEEQAPLPDLTGAMSHAERTRSVYETLTDHAIRTQAPLRQELDRLGIAYQPYYLVNAVEVQGGLLHRIWLESRPEVDRVLESPVLRPLPDPLPVSRGSASAPQEAAWNLTMIGADRVWDEFGISGQGIVIGQSDSGVQGDHPELAASYRGRELGNDYNWFDPWNHSTAPTDIGGHGTHTLGSIVGERVGVAPGAEWIGCVNLARNLANPALYLGCLEFMLAPFPTGGNSFADGDPSLAAHVLNNSWGCPVVEGCDAEALEPAIDALRAAGIFVVASAGNEGPNCESVEDPIAIYDAAFSVGAVNKSGDVATFSSRGPVTVDGSGRVKPDIAAPGENVLSAFPGGTYEIASGTSMAGPHIAGVVALLWSANPALIGDIAATETLLTETAQPYGGEMDSWCGADGEPNNIVGYGIVDAYAAVARALEMTE